MLDVFLRWLNSVLMKVYLFILRVVLFLKDQISCGGKFEFIEICVIN